LDFARTNNPLNSPILAGSRLFQPLRASFVNRTANFIVGVSGVHGGRDYLNRDETLLPQMLKQNKVMQAGTGVKNGSLANHKVICHGKEALIKPTMPNYTKHRQVQAGEWRKSSAFKLGFHKSLPDYAP